MSYHKNAQCSAGTVLSINAVTFIASFHINFRAGSVMRQMSCVDESQNKLQRNPQLSYQ